MRSFYFRQVNKELIKVIPEDLSLCIIEFMEGEPLDDTNFHNAIIDYSKGGSYRNTVIKIHGHMISWNTTKVTNMSHAFDTEKYTQVMTSREFAQFNGMMSCLYVDWNAIERESYGNELHKVVTWRFTGKQRYEFRKFASSSPDAKRSIACLGRMFPDFTDVDTESTFFENFNLDISCWDTSNVTTMKGMFTGNTSKHLKEIISGWDVSKVTDLSCMFEPPKDLINRWYYNRRHRRLLCELNNETFLSYSEVQLTGNYDDEPDEPYTYDSDEW